MLCLGGLGLLSLGLLHGTVTPIGPGTLSATRGQLVPRASEASVLAVGVGTPIDGDRVAIAVSGTSQPFGLGGAIAFTGDVIGTLTIDREPGGKRYSRLLTLALYHRTTIDTPIDDAAVQLTARMPDMELMTYRVVADPAGSGRYGLSLWVPMLGEWQLDVEIRIPGMALQMLHVDLALLSE
jgi:hypothetical protein